MKVYMVELRTVAAVSAEDETAAYLIAQRKQREILNDTEPDITVQTQAKSLADLTDGWTPDALPYGGDGETHLKDLLPETEPERDTRTIDMFQDAVAVK